MSLTLGGGPLAADHPKTVNYRLDGPERLLYASPFPRRVRAVLGGETVLDTDRGILVHETGLLPVLYAPWEDVRHGHLEASDRRTRCPIKGEAAYWHLRVGSQLAENAVWSYPEPTAGARWLHGMAAVYWASADAWFDEEERVHGHLRDPFHRVDARHSRTIVRVCHGEHTVALSSRPLLLSETGLPNRYYIPVDDVDPALFTASRTRTRCPYKGEATYWNLLVNGREIPDAAWSYPHPLPDGPDIAGHVCLLHAELTTDTERQP
ncbi:DUF427 domain-containing protein [Lipingzhangella sp. LS1_29]|uniref:DUF427 domain-containing protein n=1 Tax=Lipingzhangella rawalii TaxID=2055835 RepID=A0ABU2H7G3_9ACTN|nr:DUF427 domain-containing protein [Lipingzhangella rawalii]MDS1271233.1 DUF427 domain-containing protein [Lipingzhangella rawalii]